MECTFALKILTYKVRGFETVSLLKNNLQTARMDVNKVDNYVQKLNTMLQHIKRFINVHKRQILTCGKMELH